MLPKFIHKSGKPAIPKEALEFHPDAEELELTPVPGAARITIYVIFSLLVTLLFIACFTKADKVIPALGKIVSSGKTITISPLNDALIRSIDVRKIGRASCRERV